MYYYNDRVRMIHSVNSTPIQEVSWFIQMLYISNGELWYRTEPNGIGMTEIGVYRSGETKKNYLSAMNSFDKDTAKGKKFLFLQYKNGNKILVDGSEAWKGWTLTGKVQLTG